MPKFRPMSQDDIISVLNIQVECYPAAILEDEAIIRARLASTPDSAWVAEDVDGVCAHLVAYPSVVGNITPLGGLFNLPERADSLYLHDLAVGSKAKGLGLGPQLVRHACEQAVADGLKYSALVSVQDSRGFWSRLGYSVLDGLGLNQLASLRSYGKPSWYMVKELA